MILEAAVVYNWLQETFLELCKPIILFLKSALSSLEFPHCTAWWSSLSITVATTLGHYYKSIITTKWTKVLF